MKVDRCEKDILKRYILPPGRIPTMHGPKTQQPTGPSWKDSVRATGRELHSWRYPHPGPASSPLQSFFIVPPEYLCFVTFLWPIFSHLPPSAYLYFHVFTLPFLSSSCVSCRFRQLPAAAPREVKPAYLFPPLARGCIVSVRAWDLQVYEVARWVACLEFWSRSCELEFFFTSSVTRSIWLGC